jgi:tetratricopeptide (TPR) repeat protein
MPEVDEPVLRARRERHPSSAELLAFAFGRTLEEVAPAVGSHLAGACTQCEKRLAGLKGLARAVRESEAEDADLEASARGGFRSVAPAVEGRRAGIAAFAARARDAEAAAEGIVARIGSGAAVVEAALTELRDALSAGYVLLAALQKASRALSRGPADALVLVDAARAEAGRLPQAGTTPRPQLGREVLEAEAGLLECQVFTWLGRHAEAVEAARRARDLFRAGGDGAFSLALCDYFEASARLFVEQGREARRLLEEAAQVFAEYGQGDWVGRCESVLGDAVSAAGDHRRALSYLERALSRLDPELDAQAWTAAAGNRAAALMHLDRLDEAAAGYAEALAHSRRHGFAGFTRRIRTGLAEIRARKGDWAGAHTSFDALAAEAAELGLEDDFLFASLYAAECAGRLGRSDEMQRRVAEVRRQASVLPFDARDALASLYRCLDERDLRAELVMEVRELLEGRPRAAAKRSAN